jgi:hypothetical protein
MNVIRGLFILCIITVAVIAAESVFIVATISESTNFQNAYEDVSTKIIERFYEQMNNALWNARGVARGISLSYSGAKWPNVTVDNFDALCESASVLTHASTITFQPMLSLENRNAWENYAAFFFLLWTLTRGQHNLTESDDIDYFDTHRSPSQGIYQFENGVTLDSEVNTSILFPIWQMYPMPKYHSTLALVGRFFDETSNPVRANAIQGMIHRNGSTISSFLFQDTNQSDLAYYVSPRSNLYYPIFDGGLDNQKKSLTGSINLQINWESMLQGNSLERNETIVVVMESSCGGNFSYEVQGKQAQFLGQGQLYDKKVNANFVTNSSSFMTFASLFDSHGMAPVDQDTFCSYRITSYASQSFKGVVSLNRRKCLAFKF